MKCYLCGGRKFSQRSGKVRDDPDAEIHQCDDCGLVFIVGLASRDLQFYEQGGMREGAPPQVDHVLRETARDDQRRFDTFHEEMTNKSVLDFGCGAAGFLMRAKGAAASIAGIEPEENLSSHFQRHALEIYPSIDALPVAKTFDLVTAFHVIEHLPDPREMLARLKDRLASGGSLIVEVPSANDALLVLFNNEAFSRFTYWSCHLYLFNAHTLGVLAEQAGLRVKYIKHVQRYPLSNHLYWLAQGKPGGHDRWGFLDTPDLATAYENTLARIGKTDTLLACFHA